MVEAASSSLANKTKKHDQKTLGLVVFFTKLFSKCILTSKEHMLSVVEDCFYNGVRGNGDDIGGFAAIKFPFALFFTNIEY